MEHESELGTARRDADVMVQVNRKLKHKRKSFGESKTKVKIYQVNLKLYLKLSNYQIV